MKRELKEFWDLFRRDKVGIAGLVILVGLLLVSMFAPIIAPYDPFDNNAGKAFDPPSSGHLLGVNELGNDIFSELVFGTRISLFFGFTSAIIACSLGSLVGLVSAYYGGWIDSTSMRSVDVLLAIPTIPLMILFVSFLGQSLWTILFAISITAWTRNARAVRAQVLSLKEMPYVESARALGASNRRIMFTHILPNTLGIIVAQMIITVTMAILMEAGLAFLGLGDPMYKSWGMILNHAQTSGAFTRGSWWWVLFPGLCILVSGTSFIFIGNAVTGVFNPKGRREVI